MLPQLEEKMLPWAEDATAIEDMLEKIQTKTKRSKVQS